jgi:hypothetical protein
VAQQSALQGREHLHLTSPRNKKIERLSLDFHGILRK